MFTALFLHANTTCEGQRLEAFCLNSTSTYQRVSGGSQFASVSQEAGAQEAFGTVVLKRRKENFIYFNELPAVVDVYTHVRVQS